MCNIGLHVKKIWSGNNRYMADRRVQFFELLRGCCVGRTVLIFPQMYNANESNKQSQKFSEIREFYAKFSIQIIHSGYTGSTDNGMAQNGP